MGRWSYYSPILLGVALALSLALSLHGSIEGYFPALPGWARWPFFVGIALGVGLLCQLVLIGLQGAFAQVLPVPIGRSIRGGGAVLAGVLLLLAVGLGLAAGLLLLEQVGGSALVLAAFAGLAAAAAVVTYVWNLPAAGRDFGQEG
jgi:hypothetical protein